MSNPYLVLRLSRKDPHPTNDYGSLGAEVELGMPLPEDEEKKKALPDKLYSRGEQILEDSLKKMSLKVTNGLDVHVSRGPNAVATAVEQFSQPVPTPMPEINLPPRTQPQAQQQALAAPAKGGGKKMTKGEMAGKNCFQFVKGQKGPLFKVAKEKLQNYVIENAADPSMRDEVQDVQAFLMGCK